MSAATDLENDREQRMLWMSRHITSCKNCEYATQLKGYELEVARLLGQKAVIAFGNGEDVLRFEGGSTALSKVLSDKMAAGEIDAEYVVWMTNTASRHGKDFESA